MCRAGFKNVELRERPLTENWGGGLSEPLLTENTSRPASSVVCTSAWYADGRGFDPPVRQHYF